MGVPRRVAVILALIGAAFAGEPEKPGLGTGPLETQAVSLRRMFRLSWKGEALVLDRSIWQEAEKAKGLQVSPQLESLIPRVLDGGTGGLGLVLAFYDLGQRANAGPRFGSSGPGSAAFRGKDGLEGVLQFRKQEAVNILLRETKGAGRMLELFDDGQGELRIMLTDSKAKDVVFYNQARDGRFNLGLCREGRAEAISGTALGTLCRERPELGDGALFPLLDRLGIVPPFSPCHPDVIRAVRAARRPLSESKDESLIRQLSHDDLAKREEATRLLSERYFFLKEAIRKAADDPATPGEAKDRLRQVLEENARAQEVERFVADSGILKEKAPVPAPPPRPSESTPAAPFPPLPAGMFQQVSEHVGRMLAFVFSEGMLRLDRDHWDGPFRGKSEAELKEKFSAQTGFLKTLEGLMPQNDKAANMAKDVLGKTTEQILERSLKAKILAHFAQLKLSLRSIGSFYYFHGRGLEGHIDAVRDDGENFVHLELREESAPHRVLDCHDDGAGRLRVYAASPGLDRDVFFFQGPDGRFALFAFRGGNPRALAGARLQPLYERNREWMDAEFFGPMRHLGVLTPERQDAKESQTR